MAEKLKFFLPFLFLVYQILSSQCYSTSFNQEDEIFQAETILFGELKSKEVFWNTEQSHLFTIAFIELDKPYNSSNAIWLLSLGGELNGIGEMVYPAFHGQVGMKGIFFAESCSEQLLNFDQGEIPLLKAAQASNSFLPYAQLSKNLAESLHVDSKLYKPINSLKSVLQVPPEITNFSPNNINAGVFESITITGTGFGPTASGLSTVQFRNPDYFGIVINYVDIPPNHIVSWSDTQIEAIIPGRDLLSGHPGAASGNIRVINADGEMGESESPLTINFNKFVINLNEVDLIDDNGFGGYTFSYSDNFTTNNQAIIATERSLERWQCSIGSSFLLSGSVSSNACAGNDSFNLIAFDDECNLPTGVLAQTTHWFTYCPNSSEAYIEEIDVIFTNAFSWNFGPGPTQDGFKDFESIAVHEFGHAHGLGHVLNLDGLMYPAIDFAEDKRNIDEHALSCGEIVVEHSIVPNTCSGFGPMVPLPSCDNPCSISSEFFLLNDCAENEMSLYQFGINDVNGSAQGFSVLLDGVLINDNSIPYNFSGYTVYDVSIPADGQNHIVVIQDEINSSCFDEIEITTNDCTCGIEIGSVQQISNCLGNGTVEYAITLLHQNPSSESFQVFVEEESIASFNYVAGNSTTVNLELLANGNVITIEVFDSENANCSDAFDLQTLDCSCALTIENLIPIGNCENEMQSYSLSYNVSNPNAENFTAMLDGTELAGSPFGYDEQFINFTIPADGLNHILNIQDLLDPNCTDEISFNAPVCFCEISSNIVSISNCDDGMVDLTFELNDQNGGNQGFQVFVDGQTNANWIFNYESDGSTIASISLEADNETHNLQINDIANPACQSVSDFNLPDCSCSLEIDLIQSSDCNNDNEISFLFSLSSINGGAAGFDIQIDGASYSSNNLYNSSGETLIELLVIGDGDSHEILFFDATDNACQASLNVQTLDCFFVPNCEMSSSFIQTTACNNGFVEYEITLETLNPLGTNFILSSNGDFLESLVYDPSGTNVFTISLEGNSNTNLIEMQDELNPACQTSQLISLPDCQCDISLNLLETSVCNEMNEIIFTLEIESTNGSGNGYEIFVNGQAAETGFYDQSGITEIVVNLLGNGNVQTIEIFDLSDNNCNDLIQVPTEDCFFIPPCEMTLIEASSGDCLNGFVTYIFNLEHSNTTGQTFNVLVDGEIQNSINFDQSGSTDFLVEFLASGQNSNIQCIDSSDPSCSVATAISLPDCQCDLSVTLLASSDCDENNEINFTLNLQSQNPSDMGFEILIDGESFSVNNPYNTNGATEIDLSIIGDGAAHEIVFVDQFYSTCTADITASTSDCFFVPECEMFLSYSELFACSNGMVEFEFELETNNPPGASFNVFIGGMPIENFSYDPSGTTSFPLSIVGDGSNVLIEIQDESNPACQTSQLIPLPDCQCNLSLNLIETGICSEMNEINFTLEIESTNGSTNGYEIFVNGQTIETGFYDQSGFTETSVNLIGNGNFQTIEVFDLSDNNCNDLIQVPTEDCFFMPPCEMLLSGTVFACNNGEVALDFFLDHSNQVGEGFNVLFNGAVQGYFEYDQTGTSSFAFQVNGNGQSILVECIDDSDPTCFASTFLALPDCQCDLALSFLESSDCDENNEIVFTLNLQSLNGSSDGFDILVDELTYSSNNLYNSNGENLLEISIVGDGNIHEISFVDQIFDDCFTSISVPTSDCLTTLDCEMDLSINLLEACNENQQSTFEATLISSNTAGNSFLFFVEETLVDQIVYDPSGTTVFQFEFQGDNGNYVAEVVDQVNSDCSDFTIIQTADCQCSMDLAFNGISDCNGENLQIASFSLSSLNFGSSGYHLFLNNIQDENGPFVYSSDGMELLNLEIIGNGIVQEVLIQDVDNPDCLATVSFATEICIAPCEMEISLTQLSDCQNGMINYAAQIINPNPIGASFNLHVDGTAVSDSPFLYDLDNPNIVNLELEGDGLIHVISAIDSEDENCFAQSSLELPECMDVLPCEISLSAFQSSNCDELNRMEYTLQVEANNLVGQTFDVVLDGDTILESIQFESGLNFIQIDLAANTGDHFIQVINLLVPDCFAEWTIDDAYCSSEDCTLSLAIAQSEICNEFGEYQYNLVVSNAGSENVFTVRFNGMIISENVSIAENGQRQFVIIVPGNGQSNNVRLDQANNIDCIQSQDFTTPICETMGEDCFIEILDFNLEDCQNGTVKLHLLINGNNANGQGFDLFIDGLKYNNNPYIYNSTGRIQIEADLSCSSEMFDIQVVDEQNEFCSDSLQVENTPVENQSIKFYPNPVYTISERINILGIDASDYNTEMEFSIFDSQGNLVFVGLINGQPKIEIDNEFNFTSGLYLVHLQGLDRCYSHKVVFVNDN